jgi:hypothetical protein
LKIVKDILILGRYYGLYKILKIVIYERSSDSQITKVLIFTMFM